MPEPTPELEHWPTERMITEGYAEWATLDDIQDLSQNDWQRVMGICKVETLAGPGECIPCDVLRMLNGVQQEVLDEAEQRLADLSPDLTLQETQEAGEEIIADALGKAIEQPLDEEILGGKDWTPPGGPVRHADPAREIARQAGYLQKLVQEMLDGPPIPPRDVSEDELALLVVAAQRWLKVTDAQGVSLAPEQEKILDATRALVARLHRG